MRTHNNKVLVKLDKDNDTVETKSGMKFFVDTSYEPEKHVVRLGTVEAVPDKLQFEKGFVHVEVEFAHHKETVKKMAHAMDWETDMEIRVGDRVIMYFLAVQNSLSKQKKEFIKENGETRIFIKYQSIYAVIREGKIIPVNGYVLIEPVEDPKWLAYVERMKKIGMEAVDLRESSKKHVVFGKVAYIGTPNKRYSLPHKSDEGYDVKEGDTVVLKRVRDIPVEYEYHAKLDGGRKLYRCQRHDVLALF